MASGDHANPPWRLVVASALMLFIELALIRWTGANVLHLSYFSNFVLLGSFLGIGLGFLRSRRDRDLSAWWPVILAPLVGFVLAFPVQVTQNSDQILYFTAVRPTGAPAWITLPIIFVAVAAVMTCLGEGVGRLFPSFPALTAYRLDLIGSLIGIVTFTVLSFLHAPPLGWGLIAAAGFVALHHRRIPRVPVAALAVLVLLLGIESVIPGDSWSPYYKIHVHNAKDGGVNISVNGVPHQTIRDVSQKRWLGGLRAVPYERTAGNRLRHVLIIGAGNGNDVAVALARREGGGRRRDRPEHRRDRPPAPSQPPLPGPARAPDRRRRAGVPAAHDDEVRPRAVRAAGLPDAGLGQQLAAAGELPVHARGGRRRPVAPRPRRRVRDVQQLPQDVADRPLRPDPDRGLRPSPVPRLDRRRQPARSARRRARSRRSAVRQDLAGQRRRARRRPPPTTTPSPTCAAPGSPATTSASSWPCCCARSSACAPWPAR